MRRRQTHSRSHSTTRPKTRAAGRPPTHSVQQSAPKWSACKTDAIYMSGELEDERDHAGTPPGRRQRKKKKKSRKISKFTRCDAHSTASTRRRRPKVRCASRPTCLLHSLHIGSRHNIAQPPPKSKETLCRFVSFFVVLCRKLHAEQLARHLRQTHRCQLRVRTTCESGATCKSSTHWDPFSVVLELFLDDAFRCFAAKNYLSLSQRH
jgi:hypothetical protein